MAALNENEIRKFDLALRLLKQLREDGGGMSPNLSGVYWIVGRQALSFLTEGVVAAEQAFNRG